MTVLLAGTALAAACVQSSTGLGFALVLTPVAFAVLSPVGAIVLVTVLGVLLNLLVLAGERRRPRVAWAQAIPILIAALPGMAAGVLALRLTPKPALQTAVGVALVAAVVLRTRIGRGTMPHGGGGARGRVALGITTGALTTATGVAGPPLALWLARRGLAPAELRDSLSAMFLVLGLMSCVALTPVLGRAHLDAGILAAAAACVLVGHQIGRRVFARLPAQHYAPLLDAVIMLAGLASIVSGLSAL